MSKDPDDEDFLPDIGYTPISSNIAVNSKPKPKFQPPPPPSTKPKKKVKCPPKGSFFKMTENKFLTLKKAESSTDVPEIKKNQQDDPKTATAISIQTYKCTLCDKKFDQRSDLLLHLSITDFSKELNKLHPFELDQTCSICNRYKPKNKASYISHVGWKHEEVIKFLPKDLFDLLVGDSKTSPSSSGKDIDGQPEKTEALTPAVVTKGPEETIVQCLRCKENNKSEMFSKRTEFLKHLCLVHYEHELLLAFPFFEGGKCNLCFDTSKKMFKMEVHVCHVGVVVHGKIYRFLNKELLLQVKKLPLPHKSNEVSKMKLIQQLSQQDSK